MKLPSLREVFAGFVRTRRIARHYRRLPVFESLVASLSGEERPAAQRSAKVLTSALSPTLVEGLFAASSAETAALCAQLHTQPEGLDEAQAAAAFEKHGPNEVEQEKPMPWWLHLWHSYKTPFNLLLTLLAAVSYLTEDMKATVVIASMVTLAVLIRFVQERRSHQAADRLKNLVSNTTTVLRRGGTAPAGAPSSAPPKRELPIRLLVPGDIVLLSAGDMVPADCRILASKDLFVAQAAMTGESLPVEKHATQKAAERNVLALENIVFMGTNVVSGAATVLVLETGARTVFGALALRVGAVDSTTNPFQHGVNQVAWLLIRFMFVMTPLVLLLNGFTKGDWPQAFLFALSVAVGLTPEMLPMVATSTLAKGAVLLSRRKVIVKHLDAIQNFGAMDVLCTDKTGTLTQDRIALAQHTDAWGAVSDEVLELAYLNSHYQTGLKNLLDVAVLEHHEVHRALNPSENYRKVDEIPFDFVRRRMSVVVAEHGEHHLLICKGAVDEVLGVCTQVRHGDTTEALTPALLARVRAVTAGLNGDGLRVVAVAVRELPPAQEVYRVADEAALTLVGYVAFLDPPKESTAPALQALRAHGISVKVLTGDNELVTARVCRQVGLNDAQGVLLGADIAAMDEATLARAVEAHTLFARLTPADKERIVRRLRANGHVVGFMGDGINDAPALRSADIGISVDTAVDIAKEAADIILLEKSLMVLVQGVIEGRKTFANMLKYIKMTASSNFGNVFSVLVASAFLPFLPMLPMHLLVQNLLYDFSQTAIPFDNVDDEQVLAPQRWNPGDIGRFMLYFGPLSSVFDILTFWAMWQLFGANAPERQTLFQSGWFIEGLMTQTLVVHMIRTQKIPFVQSRPSAALLAATLLIMAVGILIPMGPLAHYFKLQALPLPYFALLAALLIGYMLLTQAMKRFYTRRFGWQ